MTSGAVCVFHRTWAEFGGDILANGFKDGAGGFVQLADVPLESLVIKGGGGGDVSLGVALPDDVLAQYEVKNTHYRGLGARVFHVPAAVLNCYPVHLHETNYIDVMKAEIVQSLGAAKATGNRLPKAPYEQWKVLGKALAFLEKYEGGDDATLRLRLVEKTAYYGWAGDPNADPCSDGQRYWFHAEREVEDRIKALGGVPYF